MAHDTSAVQLQTIRALADPDGSVSTLKVAKQLRQKYGIDLGAIELSNAQKEQIRKARRNLLKKLSKQNKRELSQNFKTLFSDPGTANAKASMAVNSYLLETAQKQITDAGLSIQPFEQATTTHLSSYGAPTPVFQTPSGPIVPPGTPQQTPQPGTMPTPGVSPIVPLEPEPAPASDTDDDLENIPSSEFQESFSGPPDGSNTTTTPPGDLIVEQLQTSMATSSELIEKAANAVDASAAATTKLQATVKDTTDALKALTDAQKKTETASPALSQQVLAQIQADPSLAKLVKDGLLKWDDLLGKNPEPGKEGHVAGVAVGDPVVLPEKLQKVIDNLQTAQTRENASLTGAIEVNRAARTTTGFRPSEAGYYPGAQVWMPIRAPPASLPGRR
eukprot:COSAG02_NODE_177_length_31154_cov_32.205152_29_plen_390_part_00